MDSKRCATRAVSSAIVDLEASAWMGPGDVQDTIIFAKYCTYHEKTM